MPDNRKTYQIVTRTLEQGKAARAAMVQADPGGATSAVFSATLTKWGIPFRDDYGYPCTRFAFNAYTRLTAEQIEQACMSPACNWLEIF